MTYRDHKNYMIKGEQKKTLQTKVGGNYSALQSPRVKKLEFFQLPGPCRFEKCHCCLIAGDIPIMERMSK